MPKATPEELKLKLEQELDKQHNKDYETPTELQEIRERVGVESDELSEDSIAQLAANVDEVKKQMDELIEQEKEAKESVPVDPPEEDEALKDAHIGSFFKELRDVTHHGKLGPILSSLEDLDTDKIGAGVPIPKSLAKVFAGISRQKTTGYLEEGQGSLGGFTVADQFIPQLLALDLMPAIMRSRAWTIQATGNVIKIPRINETTRSEHVHGGITGYWTAEGASISLSNPAFAQCVLTAKKLALLTYASNELLDDNAVGLNQILLRLFSEALGWFEDKAFIAGSGVNEPIGLRNAGCKKAVVITASTVFNVADACLMYAGLMPGSEGRAIWVMNHAVKSALPQMLSAATAENIWYPNALSIKESPEPWRLLGLPIFWTEHLPAFGTDEDICLLDPLYYILMARQDIRAAVSTDARFANDETGYRLTTRTDGQPWMASTLTLADGSTTVSPVVMSDHT